MNKSEMIGSLRCPFASISRQLELDTDFAERFAHLKGIDKYDWSRMMPRVTYNNWIVCIYLSDNKLYRIDLEDCVVEEVVVVEILECDDKHRIVDGNGNIIQDDDLHGYCDNVCCGEADDLSCYVYFDLANK